MEEGSLNIVKYADRVEALRKINGQSLISISQYK